MYVPFSVMCTMTGQRACGSSSGDATACTQRSFCPALATAVLVQTAEAIVILGTNWHYTLGASHVQYALATFGVVAIFFTVAPIIVYFVSPDGPGVTWRRTMRALARPALAIQGRLLKLGMPKSVTLGAMAYWMLLLVVIVDAGSATAGFRLPIWMTLTLILICGEAPRLSVSVPASASEC